MTEPRSVRLILPFPPSTNNLFLNGKGKARIKSPRYRAWETEALWEVKRQLPAFRTIEGPYHLHIRATAPDKRRRDIGNLEKAASDLLVTAGVVRDDCNAEIILLHKLPDITKGGSIEVIVKEAA